ncbi:hypothetical protein ACLEPN_07705 [Myxococcus sp. 1LA]
MHSRLVIVLPVLLLLVPSAVGAAKRDEAEEAYQGARKVYYALKDDAARRKLRHHWLNVAARFEAVAGRFPKSDRAPDALYTAAELLQELSRISFVEDDLKASIIDYTKLLENYPKHRLSDDGALALAKIHVHRLDQPEAARKVLTETLAVNGKGDRAREMRELLASLPQPKTAPSPRKAAPVVAKVEAPPSSKPASSGKAVASNDAPASSKGDASVAGKAVASAEAAGKKSTSSDAAEASGKSDATLPARARAARPVIRPLPTRPSPRRTRSPLPTWRPPRPRSAPRPRWSRPLRRWRASRRPRFPRRRRAPLRSRRRARAAWTRPSPPPWRRRPPAPSRPRPSPRVPSPVRWTTRWRRPG